MVAFNVLPELNDMIQFKKRKSNRNGPDGTILFVHGLGGWGKGITGSNTDYFRGITKDLDLLGLNVKVASLPLFGTIAERAEALRDVIKLLDGEIHIIAHSLGGLDSRLLLTDSNVIQGSTIRSLTSICTPHRGSAFASYMMNKIGKDLRTERLLDTIGVPYDCFTQLTTEYVCNTFNTNVKDNSEVQYYSFGATKPQHLISLPLQPSFKIIFQGGLNTVRPDIAEGDNDGLTSIKSAIWGKYLGTLFADHWEVINWGALVLQQNDKFDAKQLYKNIASHLVKEGF